MRHAYAPSGIPDTILFSNLFAEYEELTSPLREEVEGSDTSERYKHLLERQP